MIEQWNDPASVAKGLDYFHDAFNRLSDFKVPTVAAINGVCAGGGLEFALVCTARIATDAKNTVIGLPECKVGIFPGAGGTQRLPRLIGYSAIELILKGTLLPAPKALEAGIIDRIVPQDKDLLTEAKSFLKEIAAGKAKLERPAHDFSQVKSVAEMARQNVLKVTKGREIPGPMLCIQAMEEGLNLPLGEALELEKKYFAQAALSKEAKGSINTFFIKTMTDKPGKMMTEGLHQTLKRQPYWDSEQWAGASSSKFYATHKCLCWSKTSLRLMSGDWLSCGRFWREWQKRSN